MTTVQERKAADRAARRHRIQTAARTVFTERGFAATSIEQIARASQLSVGAIYLYFRSKEDLYVSLLEDALLLFDAEFTQQGQRTPAAERFTAAWGYLVSWAERDPEGARILRLLAQPGLGTQLSPEVIAAVSAGIARVQQHLASAITAGIEAGLFRPVDAASVAGHAWALLVGSLATVQTSANLGTGEVELRALTTAAHTLLVASMATSTTAPTVATSPRATA